MTKFSDLESFSHDGLAPGARGKNLCGKAAACFHVATAIGTVVLCCFALGCDDAKKKPASSAAFPKMPSASSQKSGANDLLGDGDIALDEPSSARRGDDNLAAADPLARRGSSTTTRAASNGSNVAIDNDRRWAILLLSFTGDGHADMARSAIAGILTQLPDLKDVRIERVGKGSAIVTGRYAAPADDDAKEALKKVKTIYASGRRAFQSAMLVRIATAELGPPPPFDLRTLRARFPNIKPLYTLQLGAWSTFGDESLKYAQCRTASEQFAAKLRAQGVEAWFHHDEDSETSVVTIGHFDSTAYDSRSTLFAPEVEALLDRFPAHLVNGEPVEIQVKPGESASSRRKQAPRLVEVP